MAPGSRRSLVNIQPLPVIEEDENAPARNHHPHLPFKSRRRSGPVNGNGPVAYPPFARQPTRDFHKGFTPADVGAETSKSSSKEGDDDEKALAAAALARNNHEWFTRRGGWYRVCLIVSLFVALVTALAVGLTVGLRKKDTNAPRISPVSDTLFPCGSYTVTLALTTVRTGCTALAPTFRCYPYVTLDNSTLTTYANAAAVFHWIITPNTDPDTIEKSPYAISSSENPFAPSFSNVPMTLVSAGDPLQERYTFSFEMDKSVVPAVELIPGLKEMTVCWFNGTRVTAALWTRRRALYNPSNSSLIGAGAGVGGGSTNGGAQGLGYGAGGQGGPAGSNQFAPWPYAAELQQVRAAGPGVPDCRGQDVQGVPGARKEWPVDLEVEGGGSDKECACEYANYGEGMALPTPPSAAPPLPAPASGSSTSNSASTNMPLTTTAPPAESTRASGAGQGTGPGTGAGTGAGTGGRGGMTSTMPPAAMTPTAASMVADR